MNARKPIDRKQGVLIACLMVAGLGLAGCIIVPERPYHPHFYHPYYW